MQQNRSRGKFIWRLNRSGMWAWFDGDTQASGASRSYADATEIFESNCLQAGERDVSTVTFREHPEFSRLDAVYGHLTAPELEQAVNDMSAQIASLQQAGAREFNGNGGRRYGAAMSAQSAREAAQEKLLLGLYIAETRGA